ncbi:MAG: endonuclease domain-containing protein [Alphaproteobacteria bacterium]|nr:MAG: endonuclease domain-containing protein [Alphaproteobacteria bacterium]
MPTNITSFQRQRSRKLRKDSSNPERKLWQELRLLKAEGFHFRRQHPIDRFYVDFICLDRKLAIELDGYSHTLETEYQRDLQKEQCLKDQGFRLIRFDNKDVYQNMEMIIENIKLKLQEA